MTRKRKKLLNLISKLLVSSWEDGKEMRIKTISTVAELTYFQEENRLTTITPRLISSMMKKEYGLETERRGNKNHTYFALTNEDIAKIKLHLTN